MEIAIKFYSYEISSFLRQSMPVLKTKIWKILEVKKYLPDQFAILKFQILFRLFDIP